MVLHVSNYCSGSILYYLFIEETWSLERNKEDDVYKMKQLISDFKGIESDILNNIQNQVNNELKNDNENKQ